MTATQSKPAAKVFKWLRQVARDHVNLRKVSLTYAIWLTPYLGERGIAYLDQSRESQNLGVSDRHFRTGRSGLLERGHLAEAGRNRAGNVFDRIVIRPEQGVPAEDSVPPEQCVPVEPEQCVPTDSLEESLDPLSRAKPTPISENWWPNDQGQRLAKELFRDSATFEIERFRDYWLAQQKAKRDWDAEWRVWARRQFDMRKGQQTFAFTFTGSRGQGGHNVRNTQSDVQRAADELVERVARGS